MTSQKRRAAQRAVLLLIGLAFVVYRVVDPGGVSGPPANYQPHVAPPAQQKAAKELVELSSGGAGIARQRAGLRRYLRESGVSRKSIAAVFRHTRTGIALRPGRRGDRTRLGGQPLLPEGEPWPTSTAGHRLRFVAAFDFAELPHLDPLPREGTLALYWNFDWPDEPGKMDFVAATRAYFLPPGAPTNSPNAPHATYPIEYMPLRGTPMPIAGDPNLVADEVRGRDDETTVFDAMNELSNQGLYPHHLLGAPIEVQGPVLKGMPTFFDPEVGYLSEASRSRFTAAERTSGDWMLLAQIEEQDDFIIADGGVLYFVILRQDLEAGRFDRVIGIQDSH